MPNYSIVLESVEILNTRSRHEDTDTVVLGYVKNWNGTPQIKKKFIGDVNNGKYNVELVFNDIDLAGTDTVLVMYYIVNAADASVGEQAALKMVGSSLQAGAKALMTAAVDNVIGAEGEAAIAAAIGSALGTVFPGLGNLIGGLVGAGVGYVWGLFTADCDGPVAFGATASTGAQLGQLTTAPGGRFFKNDHYHGLDSPHGCGSNSEYNVTWSILNHPAVWIGIPANGTLLREDVACGSADGQALQVVGVGSDGQLWHTIRNANGSWQGSFGFIEGQSSGGPPGFKFVDCAGAGSGLQVVGVGSDGKLWHTIRNANGSWQAGFGLIEGQSSGGPPTFIDVACGSADGQALQVVGVGSDGELWHTIRNANGSWQGSFGLIEGQSSGGPPGFKFVGCAGAGSGLQVVGVGSDGKLWHTIRNANGSWQAGFGLIEGQSSGGLRRL